MRWASSWPGPMTVRATSGGPSLSQGRGPASQRGPASDRGRGRPPPPYRQDTLDSLLIPCQTVLHHADRHATDISGDDRMVHRCLQGARADPLRPGPRAPPGHGPGGPTGASRPPHRMTETPGGPVPPGRRPGWAPARGGGDARCHAPPRPRRPPHLPPVGAGGRVPGPVTDGRDRRPTVRT